MKIKAAILDEIGLERPYTKSLPLKVQLVDLKGLGPSEVLVRMGAAGLCHSDLSVIEGNRPRPLPMILGYEAAGGVEEVGPFVHDLKPGDHIVFVFVPSCGHCNPCAEGRPALCEPGAVHNAKGDLATGETRIFRNGEPIHHHCGVSSITEYATASRRSLVKIDPDVPLKIAGLTGCAVITGAGTVFNSSEIRLGCSLAVIGLGGVGLAALIGAVAAGSETIVAIDRLQSARFCTVAWGNPCAQRRRSGPCCEVQEITRGGVAVAFEFAGSASALELGYTITRRGTTITGGLPNPKALLHVPAVTPTAEERTLKGSYIGSSVPSRDIPRFLSLYRRYKLPIDRLLSDRINLNDINAGFDKLADGTAVRQIIQFA